MGKFEIREEFYLNEQPFKIISGGIHYFRIVPEYWLDRLEKLKAMGCNTVETYIPWNLHEPKEGTFDFNGILNLREFILTAQKLGLWVILRPSPYICAEWEFGGFPAWLLTKANIKLRLDNKIYLDCVANYYKELFKIIAPLQIDYDGPVIMMQLENEYGSYGDDKKYLQSLKQLMINHGTVVPLVTSDGPTAAMLNNGTLPDVLPTANFGSQTIERFQVLKDFIGNRPLMCMEFWVGWFDAWGNKKHNVSNLAENVKDLDDMLHLGNVNIYMFHGGTNFGFMNGSNYYEKLEPDVTSYDYDAVLTEDGQITEKYRQFQAVIGKYAPIPEVHFSTDIKRAGYGRLNVQEQVSLFSVLEDISEKMISPHPMTMEQLGQHYGYILYRTTLHKKNPIEKFRFVGAADRGILFVDEKQLTIRYDQELEQEYTLNLPAAEVQFDILIENMGRVNYGYKMEHQQKGISEGVLFDDAFHSNWEHYCLPLTNLELLDFSKDAVKGSPTFYRFEFQATVVGDTFVDTSGFGKGCVFVNGTNIGRFWLTGPQKRLYLPGPLLKIGKNEIIIFESDGIAGNSITLYDEPNLG